MLSLGPDLLISKRISRAGRSVFQTVCTRNIRFLKPSASEWSLNTSTCRLSVQFSVPSRASQNTHTCHSSTWANTTSKALRAKLRKLRLSWSPQYHQLSAFQRILCQTTAPSTKTINLSMFGGTSLFLWLTCSLRASLRKMGCPLRWDIGPLAVDWRSSRGFETRAPVLATKELSRLGLMRLLSISIGEFYHWGI